MLATAAPRRRRPAGATSAEVIDGYLGSLEGRPWHKRARHVLATELLHLPGKPAGVGGGGMIGKGAGDHRAALASFRKATEQKRDYALAQFDLGQCLALEGDRKAAVEAFRVAVRCKPHFAPAHRKLGELLADLGELDEAREHLRQAVELNPADAEARKALERLRSDAAPRR
jgi:tetratricopeptide (TPR) repeat protein